jgi:hypothetical protein
MNIWPSPLQIVGIALGTAMPLLLFGCGRTTKLRGAGRAFRASSMMVIGLFAIACLTWPAARDFVDLLSAALLLGTVLIVWYIVFGLLAWGFTLTLLTGLDKANRPLTLEEWASTYMQGGDLGAFAENRLQLIVGSGMAVVSSGELAVTPFGMVIVRLVRLVRLATGLG